MRNSPSNNLFKMESIPTPIFSQILKKAKLSKIDQKRIRKLF